MVSDKVLAEEWLEELAEEIGAAKWRVEVAEREKQDQRGPTKALDKARARLRLLAQLYAALVTAGGAE